jgi:hypothetical protein
MIDPDQRQRRARPQFKLRRIDVVIAVMLTLMAAGFLIGHLVAT